MNKFKTISIAFSMLALLGLNSCDDDDIDSTGSAIVGPGTVYTLISKAGSTTSLEAALNVASGDLPSVLDGVEPYTVFAPNDGAFTAFANAAGFESSEELLASVDPTLLSDILQYHVVSGSVNSFSNEDTIETVLGDNLIVVIAEDGTIQLQDGTKLPETNPVSSIVQANGYADNGFVHIIDKVLIPQSAIAVLNLDIRPTLLERVTGTENLSILASALDKAGLNDAIMTLDTARVLAPNDDAFTDLFGALGDDYNSIDDFDNDTEISLLQDILTYHVIPVVDGSIELTAGSAATLLEDNFIDVSASGASFTFGDATATTASIVTADVDAKNGAVDVIDKVLLPQAALDFLALLASDDLATLVIDLPQLSILEEALIATELVDAFTDATNTEDADATNFTYYRPATVLAPTDAAFTDLFNTLGPDYTSIASFDTEEELELLSEILLYHVIAANISSDQLEAGMVTTASGNDIEIISVVGTDNFVFGDASNDVNANIITADVLARNGRAHTIDKVLLSQSAIDFIDAMD